MSKRIKITEEYVKKSGTNFDISNIPLEQRFLTRYDYTGNYETDSTKPDEKKAIGYFTTNTIDKSGDVLPSQAVNTSMFEKTGSVFIDHIISVPNIVGKAITIEKKDNGIMMETQFADTNLANEVWKLVKGGFAKSLSIGGVIRAYTTQGTNQFNALIEELKKVNPQEFTEKNIKNIKRIITRYDMWEYSIVGVGQNNDTLILASKSAEFPEVADVEHATITQIGKDVKSTGKIVPFFPIVNYGYTSEFVNEVINKMIKGKI